MNSLWMFTVIFISNAISVFDLLSEVGNNVQ